MERTSYREYLRAQAPAKAEKKKSKKGTLAKQVLIAIIIGAIVWILIGAKNERAINLISNNIKYNIEYSKILEGVNNIWYTLTTNENN